MPFWQKCQRCASCDNFERQDPSDATGTCYWTPSRIPFWHALNVIEHEVRHDDGQHCPAYRHDPHKPHPLDDARLYLASAQVGDIVTLRTYSVGEVSRTKAEIMRHTQRFVTVRMFNAYHRIRLEPVPSLNLRPGTLVGMPDWGVDMDAQIERRATRTERPEAAEVMLAKVRTGDFVPVIGYPPMDGVRKMLRVTRASKTQLILAYGRRKIRMHRSGPMAGIIEGEVWTLDTTRKDPPVEPVVCVGFGGAR